MNRRTPLIALGVVLGISALALWKLGDFGAGSLAPDASPREFHRAIERRAEKFGEVRLSPLLKNVPHSERGVQLASIATVEGEPPVDPAVSAALFLQYAEIEQLRYGDASAADYIHWRKSNNFRLRSLKEMDFQCNIYLIYKFMTGLDLPPDLDAVAVFARFYETSHTGHNQLLSPMQIAAERDGIVVCYGRISNARAMRPLPTTKFGPEVWNGNVGVGMRNWWEPEPEHSADTVVREHGSLLTAELGILTQLADGTVCPRSYMFYWDPAASKWMIESISDHRVGKPPTTTWDF